MWNHWASNAVFQCETAELWCARRHWRNLLKLSRSSLQWWSKLHLRHFYPTENRPLPLLPLATSMLPGWWPKSPKMERLFQQKVLMRSLLNLSSSLQWEHWNFQCEAKPAPLSKVKLLKLSMRNEISICTSKWNGLSFQCEATTAQPQLIIAVKPLGLSNAKLTLLSLSSSLQWSHLDFPMRNEICSTSTHHRR